MLDNLKDTIKNLWFRNLGEEAIYINNNVVRVRAGILLIVPIYMIFTLIEVVYGPTWSVLNTTSVDTFETDWNDRIIYQVEAIKKVFEYSFQTKLLVYILFEMLLGMSVIGARFSPTILLSSFLVLGKKPEWNPIGPKRCAWILGATFISVCIVFFNPDIVALWINGLLGTSIPVDKNYVPSWLALNLVWICLLFMWLEAILGFCVGCKIYVFLVKLGIVNRHCEACENIDRSENLKK